MRHFIIDSDTGSDDAVALVMAMRHPGVEIEAITIVAGNVPVDQGVQNALYTVELCEQSIPVYRGLSAPLSRPLETAHYVHGEDGMGDIGLPLSGRQAADGNAIDVLIDTIHRFAGEITLVTLGPLIPTSLAAVQPSNSFANGLPAYLAFLPFSRRDIWYPLPAIWCRGTWPPPG